MPELCGSTSVSTICVATAASTAEPPLLSTSHPALAASGLAATTMKLRAVDTLRDAKPVGISGAPSKPGVPGL